MDNKDIIVSHRENGWAVTKTGAKRASHITSTQAEAILIGKELAKRQHSDLSIQNKFGKIRQKNSYGNDPFPPRG